MNKKFILQLLLLVTVLFFFNSCRTDEAVQEEKRTEREKITAFAKFESNLAQKLTGKSNTQYISYHHPFKEIIENFMNNNPSYTKRFQEEVGDIYFNLRSTTYGETTKGIAYPIIKNGSVNAFLIGLVNPNRDWVNFIVVKNDSPEVQSVISKFQKYYNSPSVASKGRAEEQEETIQEIVITTYQSIPGPSYYYYSPYVDYGSNSGLGGGMSGGYNTYGGSGSQTQNQYENPCEKTKDLLQNQKIKAITDDLKNHMTAGKGEKGWRDNKTGDPTQTTQNSLHSVNFGDPSTMNGGYHNHTGTGVNMFSATDISTLIEIARYQSVGNAENGYMGVMAPGDIHYVIYFNGNHNDIPTINSYSDLQIDTWNINQKIQSYKLLKVDSFVNIVNGKKELNSKGLEQIFYSTLKSMGLDNKVTLQKVDDTNKISTVKMNSDGSTILDPCPK
nr:hypothetical protein [uncultured Chryseobacterium sp.]